jgi:hypothetical protein
MLMLLLTNRRDLFGRNIAAADGLVETLEQSVVCVHDETMGCFVAQTMDSSVGQIEGLICSKPFWEKPASVLGSVGVQRPAKFSGLTNLWATQNDDKGIRSKWVLIRPSKLSMEWQTW